MQLLQLKRHLCVLVLGEVDSTSVQDVARYGQYLAQRLVVQLPASVNETLPPFLKTPVQPGCSDVAHRHHYGKYLVVTDRELPFCTCPDYESRQERCKHIYAVEYVIQRETKPDGSTTYTESVRLTYSQDWPAYDQAQRDEKREFMRLLDSLCQTIPQPPQAKGRPRMLLSEMAFSAILKVYSTVSGRRFMGDLDAAYEKGYLTCKPHYNSVFNYLESPGLTPVLQQLIELSATPLKSVETAFAVDSTGFSTSRFDRWFDTK